MKKYLKIISVLALTGSILSCGKEEKIDNYYIVGTNAEYPPFEYMEKDKIVGFDVELMEMISQKTNIEFEWKNMNFDGLIPALQLKNINLAIAGMSITPQREKSIDFSVPYLTSKVAFIGNSNSDIKNIEQLKGKKIGVELGTNKEDTAREIEKAEVIPFTSTVPALIALKNSKIDAMVVDESVAQNYIEKNKELILIGCLEGEPKAIAFPKGSIELKNAVNNALKELEKEGKIEQLKEKYGI